MLKTVFAFVFFAVVVGCTRGRLPDYDVFEPHQPESNIAREESRTTSHDADIPIVDTYNVRLEICPKTRTVHAIGQITYTNRSVDSLDSIVMRMYFNAFTQNNTSLADGRGDIFFEGHEYAQLEILFASIDNVTSDFVLDGTLLILPLDTPLEAFSTSEILLQFSAYVPIMAHRTGANSHSMWLGMFIPVVAPRSADGWHTETYYPTGDAFIVDTANYVVEVLAPARYIVAGSGMRTEEIIVETDTKLTRFDALQARGFGLSISKYFLSAHATTASGINIHLYYYSRDFDSERVLAFAIRAMEHFEEHIGAYPFGEISIVEASLANDTATFAQIVFIDSDLLISESFWPLARGLGDQWFANVIGTNRIHYPWLNEGLTRYVQASLFYPEQDALTRRMNLEHARLSVYTDLYINRGLAVLDSHNRFVLVQGRKAMLMFYALHNRMGYGFWELINTYYQTYAFGMAARDGFVHLASQIYGASLDDFFSRWLDYGDMPPLYGESHSVPLMYEEGYGESTPDVD